MDLLSDIIKFAGVLAFAIITIVGALCQVFPGLSDWLSERGGVLRPKSKSGRFAVAFVLSVLALAALLLAKDMWIAMRRPEPSVLQLSADANGLADSIESQLRDGDSADALMMSFGGDLNALVPRFKHAGRWNTELRKTYRPDNVYDLSTWTNLVKSLRNTAKELKDQP